MVSRKKTIITKGIKTTFTPSEHQLRILQDMEAQKKVEKEQPRKNSEWQKQQDRLQAKIQQMEADRQKTEEFRNRSNEDRLRNFIKVQTKKELAGKLNNQQVPTNLNQYLTERGHDVTKPETIPTSALKSSKLDTPEKLRAAGVSDNIIRNLSYNPNNTDTSIPFDKGINWSGITESNSSALKLATLERKIDPSILFTPPNATNINKPIGRSTPLQPSVTTTGLSPPRTTLVSEVVESVNPISSNLSSLALLSGVFLIM